MPINTAPIINPWRFGNSSMPKSALREGILALSGSKSVWGAVVDSSTFSKNIFAKR